MKRQREVLALGLSAVILISLLAFAQSASAGEITLSGPDQVEQPDVISLQSSVELHEKGAISNFSLVFTGATGEAVTVTFAENGTVLDIQPQNASDIDVDRLRESLNITMADQGDSQAQFGYQSGGDVVAQTTTYLIEFDSGALSPGNVTIQMSANADGGAVFVSNELNVVMSGSEGSLGQ